MSPRPAAAAPGPSRPAEAPEFNDIFAQCSPLAWRALARLGVQLRDLPDACQEVFVVVHRRLPDFDPSRSSTRSWVYGICVRVASDYRRRHPQRQESLVEALPERAAADEPEQQLLARRAWHKLSRVLDGLESGQREAFVLYELEGLAMSDIAAILGCPLQTAYSRLHAARRAVMAAFAEGGTP